MRTIATYIISLLLTIQYLIASLGVGVHTCTAMGTTNVIILFTDSPCDHVHPKCECGEDHYHSGHHNKNCCTTEIHYLDHNYDSNQPVVGSVVNILSLSLLSVIVESITPANFFEWSKNKAFLGDGPPFSKILTNSLLAQWRL